jgi:cellulose 1,4-beta-cellobiosidase
MDIWEANSISAALTPHSCDTATQTVCTGDRCGGTYSATRYAGTCDPDGCDFVSQPVIFYGVMLTTIVRTLIEWEIEHFMAGA